MPLGKQIAWALLALPLAELGVFVGVAVAVGFAAALALMILTTFVGALVLRRVGHTGLTQVRDAVADPPAAHDLGPRLLLGLAGILLVLPGFITDVAGALLLLPEVRRRFGATIRRWTFGQREPQRHDVVDLAPDEWLEVAEPKLPPSEPPAGER